MDDSTNPVNHFNSLFLGQTRVSGYDEEIIQSRVFLAVGQ